MSRYLKKGLIVLITAFVLHFIFIISFPYAKLWYISKNWESQNMINSAFSRDIPNSNSREVIRPSADLLYSGCGFDVTYKPLIITSSLPDSYWSISFFSSNTDNFSTINESIQKGQDIKIYLFGPESEPAMVKDGIIVVSPSNTGLMLFRQFIGNSANLDNLYRNQESLACSLIEN